MRWLPVAGNVAIRPLSHESRSTFYRHYILIKTYRHHRVLTFAKTQNTTLPQIEVVDVGKLPDWPRRNCGHPFRANCLDDVVNMYESRVFLYAGSNDAHTPTAAVANTINWYATMLTDPQRDLKYEVGNTAHRFPVPNALERISSSSGFDGAGQCLTHVLNVSSLRSPAPKARNKRMHHA